jgi:predicted ABC-type ATPase
MLTEIDRPTVTGADLAFESTLRGLAYVSRLKHLRTVGYHLEIVYLRIASLRLVLERIAARVSQGGHSVPRADVRRRFTRCLENVETIYRPLADAWAVYENSGAKPMFIAQEPRHDDQAQTAKQKTPP